MLAVYNLKTLCLQCIVDISHGEDTHTHTHHTQTNCVSVYQSQATQGDDHYDEDVKAFALGDGVTGPPEGEPDFPSTLGTIQ